MSLDKLIQNCKRNDIKAQSELYKLFSSKLFSICLKYSRNYAEAQDNLQDAFLTIFEKIKSYKNRGSFEGWIKRITINTALQRYRGQAVFKIVSEEHIKDQIEEQTDLEPLSINYLLGLIQALPDQYRLVFNLYVMDNYSHKKIADMLNISEGTSKSNLSRARQILMKKIERNRTKTSSHIL